METANIPFPCEIAVKVMGLANQQFEDAVYAAIAQCVVDWSPSNVAKKLSKDGKYLSLTIPIYAPTREFIDNVYRTLSTCPEVLVTL